jgi:colanic acid/amylovoran biosynthesis glycosyltransferase
MKPTGIDKHRLFLLIPVTMWRYQRRLYMEPQACNGLRLWLQNFDRVLLASPARDATTLDPDWVSLDDLTENGRLEFLQLPDRPKPFGFFRALPATMRRIRRATEACDHYCFALWGLWGDWGAIATIIAARTGRKVAVWTDSVASGVVAVQATRAEGLRRAYLRFISAVMARYERYTIGRAHTGLFHGMDTYSAYMPFSKNPHLVHDVHLGPEYRISEGALLRKQQRTQGEPLRIIYAGRALHDKGILDWVEILAKLRSAGVDFRATWYGDGAVREEAIARAGGFGLGDCASFPGNETDRQRLMDAVRDADIFMFCHKIPESPRCLVESLLSGTPIVGYQSDYAADLIKGNGGGVLTEIEIDELFTVVQALANDRPRLAILQAKAAKDGFPMIDSNMFAHRSKLIKAMI